MRRRGLEPPPIKCGPGPQPWRARVTRVSDPSYASISSRASGNLDGLDVMDDLDVAMRLVITMPESLVAGGVAGRVDTLGACAKRDAEAGDAAMANGELQG